MELLKFDWWKNEDVRAMSCILLNVIDNKTGPKLLLVDTVEISPTIVLTTSINPRNTATISQDLISHFE